MMKYFGGGCPGGKVMVGGGLPGGKVMMGGGTPGLWV